MPYITIAVKIESSFAVGAKTAEIFLIPTISGLRLIADLLACKLKLLVIRGKYVKY